VSWLLAAVPAFAALAIAATLVFPKGSGGVR